MTTALIRGDDGGLHVRRFTDPHDAANACAAHATSLFPTMTPDVISKLIRVARRRRSERQRAWRTAICEPHVNAEKPDQNFPPKN